MASPDDMRQELDQMREELREMRELADATKDAMKRQRERARMGLFIGSAVVCLGVMGTAIAQPGVSSLHVFSANTPARATEVNANFALLQQWIEQKVGAVNSPNVTVTGTSDVTGAATFRNRVEVTNSDWRTRLENGRILTDSTGIYDVWIQGASTETPGGDGRNLAMLGLDEDNGDRLIVNYGAEYAAGVQVQSHMVVESSVRAEGDVITRGPATGAVVGERHGFRVTGTNDDVFFGTEARAAGADGWDGIIEWADNSDDRFRFRAAQCCGGTSRDVMTLWPSGAVNIAGDLTVGGQVNGYAGRATWSASTQGSTTTIPEADVIRYCGDADGCQVIIAMHNWDGAGRTTSRHNHFYYNASNGNWRDLHGDTEGTAGNGSVQHIQQEWSCYFTDSLYSGGSGSDGNRNFGILNWDQYSGETCRLTLID